MSQEEATPDKSESCCCKEEKESSSCCQGNGGGQGGGCCQGNGGGKCCCCGGFLFSDLTWAMLLLRAWVGLRLLLVGAVKFRVVNPDGSASFSIENYKTWITHAYEPFWKYGTLPEPMAKLYTGSLGYLLLAAGVMVLLGITNRMALLFGAAVMLSLSFGLFTLDDSLEIGYISCQFGLFIAAIALAKHNRLMIFGKL